MPQTLQNCWSPNMFILFLLARMPRMPSPIRLSRAWISSQRLAKPRWKGSNCSLWSLNVFYIEFFRLRESRIMSNQKLFNVAVVGITGAVGQQILRLLAERDFPVNQLKL